jgi:hypothetical protein
MIGSCFKETAPSPPGSHDHPLVLALMDHEADKQARQI